MSEIKLNSIKGVEATDAAITVNNSDGTCTANITNKPNRNLIINGAMQVAQRGTSSTTSGYGSVDRFASFYGSTDEAVTHSQVDVASGTTPYTSGFRKALKITNGNQTSGAGTHDNVQIKTTLEAQDIANSGWNYTSASSFVTFSFWVKSSVAQNFYFYLKTYDGTAQIFTMETGSLTADTWTKITKTIPGNTNLQFDNNAEQGLEINISPFFGTNFTDSGVSLNAWGSYSNSTRTPNQTSTWYTTNDATFEITGVQLEVSDHATDFEHLSFADELRRCQRYYYVLASGATKFMCVGDFWVAGQADGGITLPVEMRATPTLDHTNGADYYRIWTNGTNSHIDGAVSLYTSHSKAVSWYATPDTNRTAGHANRWITNNASAHFAFSAEL